jgi:hypothetical protein
VLVCRWRVGRRCGCRLLGVKESKRDKHNLIVKTKLYLVLAGVAVGYLFANKLATYPVFNSAYSMGANAGA